MTDKMPMPFAQNLVNLAAGRKTEICGFIMEDWSFKQITNVSLKPETSFFMDPQEMLAFMKSLDDVTEITGVFHSHPGGSPDPSPDDLQGWHPSLPYRYFIIAGGRVREFERRGDNDFACIFDSSEW